MAYDEQLADLVRAILLDQVADRPGLIEERPMFGGLAFLRDSRMVVCVSGRGGLLLAAVDAAQAAGWTAREDVEPMRMGGRSSDTWVHVGAAALAGPALAIWVERGGDAAARRR